MSEPRSWHKRKHLPHFDSEGAMQFVTWHMADGLPKRILNSLKLELEGLPEKDRLAERGRKIFEFLDRGVGSCILREDRCAEVVASALEFGDKKTYELHGWVVMPNHVHCLLQPYEDVSLSTVLHSIKSFTAHEISKIHPEIKPVWQKESFDRYIRNEEHYFSTLRYIHENPVKAGFVNRPEQFRWSSAYQTP